MALRGNAQVSLIQGQAFNYKLVFDENNASLVSAVYISSKDYRTKFCHALTKVSGTENEWEYLFTGDETKSFISGTTSYDITVQSSADKLNPQIVTNIPFTVIDRINPPSCII